MRRSHSESSHENHERWMVSYADFVTLLFAFFVVMYATARIDAFDSHHLVVDRCYIHGDPARGQKRGIAMNGGSIVVIGSHISDIKSTSQDAQAIAGWSGSGPFRVENNYLEASGENLMLGGALPGAHGLVPSDLVFRRNHVARPAAWRSSTSSAARWRSPARPMPGG